MAVVEVRGLVKEFNRGKVRAINGLDLMVEDGECLVLLGPSDSGKTTLLRSIAGLAKPNRGDVLIDRRVVTRLSPRVRRIVTVFDDPAMSRRTARANIMSSLSAANVDNQERERGVTRVSRSLGVEHLLDVKPRRLSRSERQRVALASALTRALFRQPPAVLLDDPLSDLDMRSRAGGRAELRKFQQELGITTLCVTHDQMEAMVLGDRIAVLDKGAVRQVGTPEVVYDDPVDTFVATFFGSPPMNLVPRGAHLVGFRPERLLPIAAVPGDRHDLSFTVERVEYLLGERHVHGVVSGLGEPARVISRLPATVGMPITFGETYDFAVASGWLRVFMADSGLRCDSSRLIRH